MVRKILVVGHSGLGEMLGSQQAQVVACPDEMSLQEAVQWGGSDGTPPPEIGLIFLWDVIENSAEVARRLMASGYPVVVVIDDPSVNIAQYQGVPFVGADSEVESLAQLASSVMGVFVFEVAEEQPPQPSQPSQPASFPTVDTSFAPDTGAPANDPYAFTPPPPTPTDVPYVDHSAGAGMGESTSFPPAAAPPTYEQTTQQAPQPDPFASQPVPQPAPQYNADPQGHFSEPPPQQYESFPSPQGAPEPPPQGNTGFMDPNSLPQREPQRNDTVNHNAPREGGFEFRGPDAGAPLSRDFEPGAPRVEEAPQTVFEPELVGDAPWDAPHAQQPSLPQLPTQTHAPQPPEQPQPQPPAQPQYDPYAQQPQAPQPDPFAQQAPAQQPDPFAPQPPEQPQPQPPAQPQYDPYAQQPQAPQPPAPQHDPFAPQPPAQPQYDPFAQQPQAPQPDPYAPQPDPYAPQPPAQPPAQPQYDPYAQQSPEQPQAPQPPAPQHDPFAPQPPAQPQYDPYAPQSDPYAQQAPAPQHDPFAPQPPAQPQYDPFAQQPQAPQPDPYAPQPDPYAPQPPAQPPTQPQYDPFAQQPIHDNYSSGGYGGHGPSTDFSSFQQQQRRVKKAQVHTFAVPKGGTGKSSLAAVYAAVLSQGLRMGMPDSEEGPRVLLIDANVQQADSRRIMGLRPQRTILDLARTVFDESTIESYLTPPSPANPMWLLAGPVNKAEADPNLITPALYRRVTDILLSRFDHIVIDTPEARLFDPMLADYAMPITDWLMVPVLQNRPVLDGTKEWLELIQAPRHVGGYAFDSVKVRLIMNMARESVGYSTETLSVDLAAWEFAGEVAYSDEMARATNEYRLPLDDPALVNSVRRVIYSVTGNPVFSPAEQNQKRGRGKIGKGAPGKSATGKSGAGKSGAGGFIKKMMS